MKKNKLLEQLKGKLIVSCQAQEGEPLESSFIMGKMALAAYQGGAAAIRAESIADIKEIKKTVPLPIIGLIKKKYNNTDRYITTTMKEVNQLIEVGVDIIAIDATKRPLIEDITLAEVVSKIKKHGILTMGDISTLEEAILAEKYGFDMISTALSGYTPYSPKLDHPDYNLIKKVVETLNIPVFAEGKIFCLKELKKVLKLKPYSVVIGSAITRPQIITEKYVGFMRKETSNE